MKDVLQILAVLVLVSSGLAQYDPYRQVIMFAYNPYDVQGPSWLVYQNDDSIRYSRFSFDVPSYFLVHGYKGNAYDEFNNIIRDVILSTQDANVVSVDWQIGAYYDADFELVMNRTQQTALFVADFIVWLEEAYGYNISNVHLVGFSLGGYLAGWTGRALGSRLPYLVALDPYDDELSVTKDDAVYVEVIHTSPNSSIVPIGHNDFYPNKGEVMTGCEDGDTVCSNLKAPRYFAESILSGNFVGTHCESYEELEADTCSGQTLLMGGLSPKEAIGIFTLKTNAESPYAQG